MSLPSRRTVLTATSTATIAGAAAFSGSPPAEASRFWHIRPPKDRQESTTPKRDLRAMWIATVENIDWPSAQGLTAAEQRRELLDYLDLAVEQRHNAVILQVRPTADAFWPSSVEPWSAYLTGTQGVDPGWDPLGFAVKAAHQRGLELHAWFNPFRVSQGTDREELAADHPGRQHPEWVVEYGGKLYYNPGLPQVRKLSQRAIMDAVKRYDVDAVHFDDYFYPYPVEGAPEFDDEKAYARYGRGQSLADWRRDNITSFMTGLRRQIQRVRPTTQMGVSPFAIWRNKSTDPEGSDTQAGAETYDDLYADTRKWVRDETLDYVAPQVYWSRGFEVADYEKITTWWADQVRGTHVHLYIGQALYKVGENADVAWDNPEELSTHLDFNREFPRVEGNMYFSAKTVRANPLGAMSIVNEGWYSRPALTPVSPWLDDARGAPRRVGSVWTAREPHHPTLQWNNSRTDATSFVIYRIPGRSVRPSDLADARYIADIVPREGRRQSWIDSNKPGGRVTYVVTPVDRVRREGVGTIAR